MTTTNEADELTARAVSCPCQTRRIHARTASAVGFAPWRGVIPTLETPRPMLWIVDQKMIGGDVQCGSEGVQVGVPLRPPDARLG